MPLVQRSPRRAARGKAKGKRAHRASPSPDALAAGKLPDPSEGEAEAARLNAEVLGHIAEADRSGLGPAEVALLEAADRTIDWYGRVDAALMAQVRGKLTDLERGTGGELIQLRKASMYLYNTLDYPDFIAADASAQRMHLAREAGALALGVDTADTIQAANSAELMLAHQLAAAHAGAMKLMGQLSDMMLLQGKAVRTDDSANVRVTRLAGAASRLMMAFQQGMVTLDRLGSGGRQHIVVQHVQVNDGGQAVVAGKMKAPRAKGRGSDVPTSGVSPNRKNSGRSRGGTGRK